MKKVVRILLIISVLSLTGCDFLRMVAGRPTSAQLAEKQRLIDLKNAAVMLQDSLAAIEADSIATADTGAYDVADDIAVLAEAAGSYETDVPAGRSAASKDVRQTNVTKKVNRRPVAPASVKPLKTLEEIGIKTSSVFSFGEPLEAVPCKYSLIVGVYRDIDRAEAHYKLCENAGLEPYFIKFGNGARALCLCGSDEASDILDVVSKADSKVCPVDAWVYTKAE